MKAEEAGGGGGGGGGGGRKSGAGGLKKGPWTPAEDAILMEHVRKHGEGNWNAVQRQSGLARCGKSCRLRWANHLRPNLKKGSFTPDEELLILRLHAQLGNKWARMAAQLPGRTDNEIKNYWNTRLKRRQRAGLPMYPPEIKESGQHQASAAPVADYSGAHFPSLRPAPLFDPAGLFPLQPPIPRNPFQCHAGFGLPISPVSSPSTPTSMLRPLDQLGLGGYDLTPPPPFPLPSLSPLSRPIVQKSELPSSQFFPQPYAGGLDGRGSFGLLEALLQDSHIDGDIRIGDLLSIPVAGDQSAIWGQLLNGGSGDGSSSDDRDGIKDACQNFSFGSVPKLEVYDCDNGGAKFTGEVAGDAGTAKDDLSTLLDIPMETISMIPEWCSTNGGAEFASGSGQPSSAMASDEMGSAFLRWLLPSPPPPPPSTIGTSVHGHGAACLESVKDIII